MEHHNLISQEEKVIQKILNIIDTSIDLKKEFFNCNDNLQRILDVTELIKKALKMNKKIMLCGNGGSAADAQHLAAEFVNKFHIHRKALHAIALTTDTSIITAISNDSSFDYIFSRQIEAIGNEGDVLIVISTSGNSKNIKIASEIALKKNIITIGFLGNDGGKVKDYIDFPFIIPSKITPRIQEVHIILGHIICDLVEQEIIKNED